MSVSFFEIAQAGLSGRASRTHRTLRTHRPAVVRRPMVRRDAATRPWQRHAGWALIGAGAAMVPWLFVLAGELPAQTTAAHWNTAWVGLDSLEALGLASTGLLLRRQDSRAGLTSAATATLLAMDAWFDVLTSAPGTDRTVAIAMAVGAELPLAALCAYLAVRLHPASADKRVHSPITRTSDPDSVGGGEC